MSSYPASYGPFDLIERINYGGMSEVFRAFHRDKGVTVALKRILPTIEGDEEFITLFEDEARIAQVLDHENIARIIDFGEVDASHYIAFEHVHGQSLRRLIDRTEAAGEKVPIDTVVYVIAEVCRGLAYAHDRTNAAGKPLAIVHRDVSPHNVLISYEGRVKLIDFGIAKAIGKLSHTQTGSIKGKMGYMAPEQTLGQVDRRSDVFSLGICLWEALTSERLFPGDNELLLVEQIRKRPVPPPSSSNPLVPPELDRITLKALAKDPNQRYPSASDFEAELRALARSAGLRDGALVDETAVAALMSRLFLGASPSQIGPVVGQQEKRMSDKGGSDLDVFDGLAKKPRQSTPAPSSGPRPAPPPARQKTLLGLAAPLAPPPPAPPPPGLPSRSSGPAPGAMTAPMPAANPQQIPTRPPPPAPPKPSLPPPGRTPTMTGLPIPAPPPPIGSAPPAGRPPSSSFPKAPAPPGPPGVPAPARSGPPSAPKPANAAPVDMDWDDEDEKTAVFEKSSHEDAARSLLRSAPPPAAGAPPPPAPPPPSLSAPPPSGRLGGAAALLAGSGGSAGALSRPPMPLPSRPAPMAFPSQPAAIPAPALPPPASSARASLPSYPQQRSGGRTVLMIGAILLVAGFAAALAFVLMPRKGSLVVTVAGPGNKAIDSVQILVNDSKKCDTSPCRVQNLESGTHMVKIVAAGYQQTAAQAVKVQGGEDAVLNITLAAASGTGVRVMADGAGLRLVVDGKDVGPLPQDLKDLTPGEHTFRIEGGDRYEPWEKRVTVEADRMQTLEPKLKVLKGIATIKAGQNADGARVLLVSGTERRPIPQLPIKIDITTNKSYTLVAQRAGYSEFRQDITFEDGQAEKTFVIDMTEAGSAPVDPPTPAPGPRPGPAPGPRLPPKPAAVPGIPAPPPAAEEKPVAATGQGTININSIPVSNAILDGKPLGSTPKSMKVPAGPHTVVFVHPEHGRKVRAVTVRPNESVTAAVKFP